MLRKGECSCFQIMLSTDCEKLVCKFNKFENNPNSHIIITFISIFILNEQWLELWFIFWFISHFISVCNWVFYNFKQACRVCGFSILIQNMLDLGAILSRSVRVLPTNACKSNIRYFFPSQKQPNLCMLI